VEAVEGLESALQQLKAKPIAPTAASLKALSANRDAYADYVTNTIHLLGAGDRATVANETSVAFKQRMVEEAQRLALAEGPDGKLVKSGFAFGFADYITGGKMPPVDELAVLARRWDDVCFLFGIVAAAEAVSVEELAVVPPPPPPEEPVRKKGKAAPVVKPLWSADRYTLKFKARPPALVAVINALATSPRFVSVEGFTFGRGDDRIQQLLNLKDPTATTRPSRRSRRGAVNDEGLPAQTRQGPAIEPERDTPFTVELQLAICDFGTVKNAEAAVATAVKERE